MKEKILALGGESEGVFAVLKNNSIFISENFGDLLNDKNFQKFKKAVLGYLQKNKIKPNIILSDLHPLYKTTLWAKELAKRFKAKHLQIQHHLSHIFSAIGDKIIENCKLKIENYNIGIACDGTGYGLNGKIWGGEIFKIQNAKVKMQNDNVKCKNNKKLKISRIGHLENQIMIGGDLTVKEPARMLISILSKFLNKKEVYKYVKKYYSKNQFELLFNQLQQNFNCQETSSTGRILDAVSLFLGFAKNQRRYKHEPIKLLEKNSTTSYKIKPKIIFSQKEKKYILLTTPLFEYLIKNPCLDKQKLAATSQFYIAKGLYKICQMSNHSPSADGLGPALFQKSGGVKRQMFFSGGIANNKIISSYLESKGVFLAKKIPRGDTGLAFGQLIFYVLKDI